MNIDTNLIQYFLAVAEAGCISKAAARVCRTQSAVSQQIAKLENMIGKTLFIRGKSALLTSDGELFLSYARQIYALHREVLDRFREPELEGQLKFGMPEDFASVYLSDVLVDFTRIHPRVVVNVECDLTLNLVERFKRDEFDIVLLKLNRPNDIQNSIDVYSEKLEWVSHPSLKHDAEKPVPLILSPQPCVYRARAIKSLDDAGIKWRLVFSSPSYAGTIAAVKAGLGITILPKTMIPAGLEIYRSHLPSLSNTHICLLKRPVENPALKSFEKFVFEKLRH